MKVVVVSLDRIGLIAENDIDEAVLMGWGTSRWDADSCTTPEAEGMTSTRYRTVLYLSNIDKETK